MHVLMLAGEFPPFIYGGAGTYLDQLTTALREVEATFTVLVGGWGEQKPQRCFNRRVVFHCAPGGTPLVTGFENFYHQSDGIERYAVRLCEEEWGVPDVLHCQGWIGFPVAEKLRERWGTPIVTTVHGLEYPAYWRWGSGATKHVVETEHRMCAETDRLIAVSHSIKADVCLICPQAQPVVIYNGADPPDEEQGDFSENATLLDGRKVILFAGRLEPQKGIRFLLDAANIILKERSDMVFAIAGNLNNDYAARLRCYVQGDEKLAAHVSFMGLLGRPQLWATYKRAAVAVVPSIYEPFGYAALEALAAGVPVVASRCGGLTEILEDGKCGALVDVKLDHRGFAYIDPAQLAAALIAALDDQEKAAEYRTCGRARAALFSAQSMAKDTYQVYREVMAGNSKRVSLSPAV